MRSVTPTIMCTINSVSFVVGVLALILMTTTTVVSAKSKNLSTESCSDCSEPGFFCGVDGNCHEVSCQTYYQFADRQLTGYADDSTFQCFGYSEGARENAHGVIYGCDPLFPFTLLTPGKQVTEAFNRKCTAEREGGYTFECYEFMPSETATDFTFFELNAESSFPDCGDGKQPKYWYITASSNHYVGVEGLQGNPIVAAGADNDGDTIWATNEGNTFNRDIAIRAMYANVVGGPDPNPEGSSIQIGTIDGNNPLKNPRPNRERTDPIDSGVGPASWRWSVTVGGLVSLVLAVVGLF